MAHAQQANIILSKAVGTRVYSDTCGQWKRFENDWSTLVDAYTKYSNTCGRSLSYSWATWSRYFLINSSPSNYCWKHFILKEQIWKCDTAIARKRYLSSEKLHIWEYKHCFTSEKVWNPCIGQWSWLLRGSQWGCSKHGTRLKISRFHGARLIFTSNNCSELRKSYKQHGYLDKIIHDTRLIFSLFHDTRLIFWTFHATRLTPLRPSFNAFSIFNADHDFFDDVLKIRCG